jgi:GrpB-like predicted nucleotidyltransferase (UPF0157 family)
MQTLVLVPYNTSWPARFDEEASRLREALGTAALRIEHVGSTAVPVLAGKPVLDIAIAVASTAAADSCVAPLTQLAYDYRGPHGPDPQRRYYSLDVDGTRTTQVHLYVLPAVGWNEMLLFRNALRADTALAAAYTAEKFRIAEAVGWDKHTYALAKEPFVERVLATLRRGKGADESFAP